jgi:hypothetical protein
MASASVSNVSSATFLASTMSPSTSSPSGKKHRCCASNHPDVVLAFSWSPETDTILGCSAQHVKTPIGQKVLELIRREVQLEQLQASTRWGH